VRSHPRQQGFPPRSDFSRGNLRWCPWSLHRWSSTGPQVWGHQGGRWRSPFGIPYGRNLLPYKDLPQTKPWKTYPSKNWMGPNPNGPYQISCDRATGILRVFFRGPWNVGPFVGDFLKDQAFSTHKKTITLEIPPWKFFTNQFEVQTSQPWREGGPKGSFTWLTMEAKASRSGIMYHLIDDSPEVPEIFGLLGCPEKRKWSDQCLGSMGFFPKIHPLIFVGYINHLYTNFHRDIRL